MGNRSVEALVADVREALADVRVPNAVRVIQALAELARRAELYDDAAGRLGRQEGTIKEQRSIIERLEHERDEWIQREQEVRDGSLADAWRALAFKERAKLKEIREANKPRSCGRLVCPPTNDCTVCE